MTGQIKLTEAQNAAFDQEYFANDDFNWLVAKLQSTFDRPIRLLDVGGGNGIFIDRLIEAVAVSEATNIDLSEALLAKNKQNKTIIKGSILDYQFPHDTYFDMISINWMLHHMVAASEHETVLLQQATIAACRRYLAKDGVILISENDYRSWLCAGYSGALIYWLTRSRSLAPLIGKFANTAGVGVRFRPSGQWRRVAAPLYLRDIKFGKNWPTAHWKRVVLGMLPPRHVHMLLTEARAI